MSESSFVERRRAWCFILVKTTFGVVRRRHRRTKIFAQKFVVHFSYPTSATGVHSLLAFLVMCHHLTAPRPKCPIRRAKLASFTQLEPVYGARQARLTE